MLYIYEIHSNLGGLVASLILTMAPSTARITGETLASAFFTAQIAQAAYARGRAYRAYDVGDQSRALGGFMRRLWAYMRLWAQVAIRAALGRKTQLYLVCPGGRGVFLFAILVAMLRPFADTILCHHHGRHWMGRRNRFLGLCLFAPAVGHLTQCEILAQGLRRAYPDVRAAPVSNAAMIPRVTVQGRRSPTRGLVLGYLSNLTFEKGVDTAIDLIAELAKTHPEDHLHIAGRAQNQAVADLLQEAQDRGLPVTLWGQVADARKSAFFDAIDVFLFPTRYALEAEPLVILEALAHGRPVVAHDLGCIGVNVTADCGQAIAPEAGFLAPALAQLALWRADRAALAAASVAAQVRHGQLQTQSHAQIAAHILAPLGLEGAAR